jgi:hypothetical protein
MGNNSTLLLLLVGLVALLGAIFFISSKTVGPVLTSPMPPEVLNVEFPAQVQADGNNVGGLVEFRDPNADIVWAHIDIVEADLFFPFEFDPLVSGQTEGSFQFSLFTLVPQQMTLSVTLVDAEGQRSDPFEFEFTVLEPAEQN